MNLKTNGYNKERKVKLQKKEPNLTYRAERHILKLHHQMGLTSRQDTTKGQYICSD